MRAVRPGGGELLPHVEALDGVRFFAFLAVYVHHATQNRPGLHVFTAYGALGVQVFFVLSGFLIGSILHDLRVRSHVPLKSRLVTFYARRGLRIFPLYYLALLLLLPLPILGSRLFGAVSDFPWNIAYLSNLRMVLAGRDMGGLSHLWSLSVEEHFYLVAPFLVLTLGSRALGYVCASCWVGCMAARAYLGSRYPEFEMLSPLQFDCLLVGIATAILNSEGTFLGFGKKAFVRFSTACGILSLPLLAARHAPSEGVRNLAQTFEQFVFSWATAGFILYLWTARDALIGRVCSWRPFTYLGKISYGLYVWHFPILLLGSSLLAGAMSRGTSVIALGLTIAFSAFSFHVFERPVMGLKRYFGYRTS